MFSSLFKLCTKHAVYLMVWAFSHCNIIYVPRWAYMTFDPHSGSGIILVPSYSRPLSLNVSSVHSMTSVTLTLTSLWRESTLMSCGHHLYCESILVLQATPFAESKGLVTLQPLSWHVVMYSMTMDAIYKERESDRSHQVSTVVWWQLDGCSMTRPFLSVKGWSQLGV